MQGQSLNTIFSCMYADGQPPVEAHGNDTNGHGYGLVSEHRLYQLIRQSDSIIYRQFEIEFFGPGKEAFAFTLAKK